MNRMQQGREVPPRLGSLIYELLASDNVCLHPRYSREMLVNVVDYTCTRIGKGSTSPPGHLT